MYIDLTPELRELRDELRGYFEQMMTPALRAELAAGGEGGGDAAPGRWRPPRHRA